jgi:uncharacterized protein YbaP (TraB family)
LQDVQMKFHQPNHLFHKKFSVFPGLTLLIIILFTSFNILAQGKYPSLMWKISGNGLKKPSYLYGTMHISGKLVFHLGDQFYDAIGSVDVVALELEPEAWLDAIFKKESDNWYASRGSVWTEEEAFGYDYSTPIPKLNGQFKLELDIREKIAASLSNDPVILNYLMFRYDNGNFGADFEEDTWLDMHIYQTGKKLGKKTIGLETYDESDKYIKLSRKAQMSESDEKEYDDRDIEKLNKLQQQFEPAYRRQDLDLLDSLNRISTSQAFQKYILIERNKVFVTTIDSVLRSGQSLLAGMGCAHLPGQEGIIEMLRNRGYTIETFEKGERNTRRRSKIENQIYSRPYAKHTTSDQVLNFSTPSELYYLGTENGIASWITLDIPNGGSFMIDRIKTYAGISGIEPSKLKQSLDSVLYESIPGDIISQKKITINGLEGIDIQNKTRRGNYQRRIILFSAEEIYIFKLTATGEKVKNGYGNEFFNSIKYNQSNSLGSKLWKSVDGSLSCMIPGEIIYYEPLTTQVSNTNFEVTGRDKTTGSTFILMRHTTEDPQFIDESEYETNRLCEAWIEDFGVKIQADKTITHQGLHAKEIVGTTSSGEQVFARFVIDDLDYYALAGFKTQQSNAQSFFDSFSISPGKHNKFFPYTDTTLHFTTLLPIQKESTEENIYSIRGQNDDDHSSFQGKTEEAHFMIPGEPDQIQVKFQRFHKFSDGESKEDFVNSRIELINDSEMKLEKKDVQWNDQGFRATLTWCDTASTRQQKNLLILHNKSLYTVTTTYDSIIGQSDFAKEFCDHFIPTDTTFSFNHFENRDLAFLDALTSGDSTERKSASNIISEMDFSDGCSETIRSILDNLPTIEKKETRERVIRKLTAGLSADTSSTNIAYIVKRYYANSDSIAYQSDLLRTLAMMQTTLAEQTFRKLLLDEPPVNSRSNPVGFAYLNDSLELVQNNIVDYLKLISLDDYQYPVFELTAALIDSNMIKPESYKNDRDMILLEARNELKQLNAREADSYAFDTEEFLTLCKLLHPFRKEKDVQSFFAKAYRSKKHELLLDLIDFDLERNQNIGDSTLIKLFNSDKHVLPTIKNLEKHNQSQLIPEKYKSREQLAILYYKIKFDQTDRKNQSADSIQVISRKNHVIRGNKFDVFYIRYKKSKTKQWLGTIIAFDDSDPEKYFPRFLEKSKSVVLDDDEDEMDEMNRSFKQLVELNRRNFYWSTGNKNRNYY